MITKRKLKGKYYGRLRLNGKEKLLPLNTSYSTEADKLLKKLNEKEALIKARLLEDLELGDIPTLIEAIDIFLKDSNNNGLEQNTIKHYGYALKHLINIVGKTLVINNITDSHLQSTKQYLLKHYSKATVNSYIKSINAFSNWLEKKYDIKLPSKIQTVKFERTLPEFLTPDELDRIYSLCNDEKMFSTFKVYEYTGIRLRELHSCDLDLTENGTYIKLKKTKGKRERIIPIPPDLANDFKIATEGSIYKPDYISKTFSKLRNKAKISSNKTLHSLRHTFALRKLLELGNIYLVKELLGHSSVTTTQIYLDFPDGYIKEIFSQWLPNAKEDVDSQTLEIAKLLQQNGYSKSLKN